MPCVTQPNTYYVKPTRDPRWYETESVHRARLYYNLKSLFQRDSTERRTIVNDSDTRFDLLLDYYLATRDVILKSKALTELGHDWDDEGAEGYSAQTWDRAARFTEGQAKAATENGFLIGVPMISPADRGSIDIYWHRDGRNLLINVPADPTKPATFYGTNMRGENTSGLLDTSNSRVDLLFWLSGEW